MPITSPENWLESTNFLINLYQQRNLPLQISYASEEFANFITENFPNQFSIKETRDYFDYLYSAKDLKSLRGRKYDKKRNHINKFKKTYQQRYCFRPLTEADFNDCRDMLKKWQHQKRESDGLDTDYINDQMLQTGIENLLTNYKELNYKISGVYIDNTLEAFSIGSYLLPNIAQIHVEKANPNIRGLYQILNQNFLSEFENAKFVNREDDAGVESMRSVKLSYNPVSLLKKYQITTL